MSVVWLCSRPASAQLPAEPAADEQSLARSQVVVGIVGMRSEALRGGLIGLLRAELAAMGLSLVELNPAQELSVWASRAVQSERTLLAILLDARSDQRWRLVVIDAARSRAIARDLPGGIRRDAASIEAVVSIAASAAGALREGLEVASSPLETIVGASPVQPRPARRATNAAESSPEPSSHGSERSYVVGSIGAAMASFSPQALTTNGMALALGIHWRARLEARAFGALFWPTTIDSQYGQFRVNRALLGAAAGPVFQMGKLAVVPEAGIVIERLRRSETIPAAGVLASEGKALHRLGAVLAVRLRLPLIRPLSAELVAGAAYFGRGAQFSTTGLRGAQLAEVLPIAALAQLGIAVATD
jgi:hypothetical protein